jgi:peptidyl-prolyl cis-trans isomerase D
MFEFIRSHTRVMLFALVLLIIPSFVFFGIQGYADFNKSGRTAVATVAGLDITQEQVDAAHAQQIDRLRRQIPNLDAKLFESPEMKRQTLNALIDERLTAVAAVKSGFVTTDERLLRTYMQDPQFASFRNTDGSLNKEALQGALTSQGMTIAGFEARLRQDIASRQVMLGIGGSAFAPASAASAAFDALYQQREIEVQRFDAKSYLSKANPTDAEIEAYYRNPAHAAEFLSPEQADVQYVMLDLEALKKNTKVSDEALRAYYAQNDKRFATAQERRASHILINAPKAAPDEERQKARAKADALLAEVRKNPSTFAEVARKNSQDEGSAVRGGDLDFFARGAMVKPFEDAVFTMKPGDISDVVESDFGFHIIQLTQVRGGDKKPFETARAEIENEVLQQQAQKEFSEAAVEFTNTVYEQADGLQPVADRLKLQLQTARGVTRVPNPNVPAALASQKLLEAVFSDEVLRNKRNTEAVETGPNQLVSARVLKYNPAATMPLADVKARIRETLGAQQAAALARKEGEARLAQLKSAVSTSIAAPVVVSRAQAQNQPTTVIDAALRASAKPLPSVVGVDLGGEGYAVVKVTKVLGRDATAAAEPERLNGQYAQAWAIAEMQAYTKALRDRFKVKIKDAPAGSLAVDPAASGSK